MIFIDDVIVDSKPGRIIEQGIIGVWEKMPISYPLPEGLGPRVACDISGRPEATFFGDRTAPG